MIQCSQKAHVYIKTVNIIVLFVKSNDNTYPKGRALMQLKSCPYITKNVHVNDNRQFKIWTLSPGPCSSGS